MGLRNSYAKLWLILGLSGIAMRSAAQDRLAAAFEHPPVTSAPRVWYHWLDGQVSKEGIKLDLEWMHRVGIGGVQMFDASFHTPMVVPTPQTYMSTEWKDSFSYMVKRSRELGIDVSIAASPGWSETGGPWVPGEDAMKKLVWSSIEVDSSDVKMLVLPSPSSISGPFQDIPAAQSLAADSVSLSMYRDVAVIAFPSPRSGLTNSTVPVITSSGGTIDEKVIIGGTIERLDAAISSKAWIQFAYPKPQTIQSLVLQLRDPANPIAAFLPLAEHTGQFLESSDDGTHFSIITELPATLFPQRTISFTPVTAAYFRLVFDDKPESGPPSFEPPPGSSPHPGHLVERLVLSGAGRIHRFEEKAGFATYPDLSTVPTPESANDSAIPLDQVLDVTNQLDADGTLRWKPKTGRWIVLRFGYSLTGSRNSPAEPVATGLEVDKLDGAAVQRYLTRYFDQYSFLGVSKDGIGPPGISSLVTDSWEAGVQNWTPQLPEKFQELRGYDMHHFLPALAGYVVQSAATSDRFLWDFRNTLSDLVATQHYGTIDRFLKQRGMGRYGESHESGRAFIGDGMQVKKFATVPMGAMWTFRDHHPNPDYDSDLRESASVSHIYGQNLVGAESFTAAESPYAWSPAELKPVADRELAMGVNFFSIHTSVHQPSLDKVPGIGLGPFGQWFTRNETWAEEAGPWITYLSRSSYLLQQGRAVVDLLYFYGEDTNATALYRFHPPEVPQGYGFDFANADVVAHELSIVHGAIQTKSGMRYKALVIDPHARSMSLLSLKAISALVREGALVIGLRPTRSPSLQDNDAEFRRVVEDLWGPATSGVNSHSRSVGQGHLIEPSDIRNALSGSKIDPDVEEYGAGTLPADLLFAHRKLGSGDLYFISSQASQPRKIQLSFRTSGRQPESWDASSGEIKPVSYAVRDGRTIVPLDLSADDAKFVLFRHATALTHRSLATTSTMTVAKLPDVWTLTFIKGPGASKRAITNQHLGSWTERTDSTKYFSGTALYESEFELPKQGLSQRSSISKERLLLDLGDVRDIASVSVNGRRLNTLWKAPYRVDLTGVVRPGRNSLSISVTNLWVNRLVGDAKAGKEERFTFTNIPFYGPNSPLMASGLLGPVRLLSSTLVPPRQDTLNLRRKQTNESIVQLTSIPTQNR